MWVVHFTPTLHVLYPIYVDVLKIWNKVALFEATLLEENYNKIALETKDQVMFSKTFSCSYTGVVIVKFSCGFFLILNVVAFC